MSLAAEINTLAYSSASLIEMGGVNIVRRAGHLRGKR